MIDIIIDSVLKFKDYCFENKKQSIIGLIILALGFSIFGYFSLVILAKIVFFIFSVIFSVICLYFTHFIFTIPITLFIVYLIKK